MSELVLLPDISLTFLNSLLNILFKLKILEQLSAHLAFKMHLSFKPFEQISTSFFKSSYIKNTIFSQTVMNYAVTLGKIVKNNLFHCLNISVKFSC